MSTRPAGACLTGLAPERNGDTRHAQRPRVVIGAVDTHGRTHHAAVIDQQGRLLGDQELPADSKGSGGYRQLLGWRSRHGSWTRLGWKPPAATAPGRPRELLNQHLAVVEAGPARPAHPPAARQVGPDPR